METLAKDIPISVSPTFEAYGISAVLTNIENLTAQANMLKHPRMGALQFDMMAMNSGNIATALPFENQQLKMRYKNYPSAYYSKIINFYREGDIVSEWQLNNLLGNKTKIRTGLTKFSTNQLHSITNYRYQKYNQGNIITTGFDINNSNILRRLRNTEIVKKQKIMYNACFSMMPGFREML